MLKTRTEGLVATFRSIPVSAGGYRIEFHLHHTGTDSLVDFYQDLLGGEEAYLLHPHESPQAFRACPSVSAPGWTCLGDGVPAGETIGPFVAWCARVPVSFKMRWRAENTAVGGTFEIAREPEFAIVPN